MQFPGFCGDSYVSQSRLASCCRSVNLYPETVLTEAPKAKVVLYPSPGLRLVASKGTSAKGRGTFALSGRAFAVYGPSFDELTATVPDATGWRGTLTTKGTVIEDANPVSIAGPVTGTGGIKQLGIASGNRLSLFNLNDGTFTPVINDVGGSPVVVSMLVFLNSRLIGLDRPSSTLRISDVNRADLWQGQSQATTRTDAGDPWRSIALSTSKEVWLLGERTGSIYYDGGTATFPLVPRAGVVITPGIVAPYSLVEVDGAMMWLAQGNEGAGTVVRARGYQSEIISTEAVNYAIRRLKRESTITDAVAYTYEEQGHHFYVLNFPTADATWVYDAKTNWWHERGSYNGATGLFDAWGPQYHMYEFDQHLVADHLRGNLYEQSIDLFQDVGGAPLRRLRVAPGLSQEQRRVFYDEFRLYLERGVTRYVNSPAVVSQQPAFVGLRVSNDGGKTFGSERIRSIGRPGQYRAPYIQWDNLGSATDRVFAVHMTDAMPWRLIDAYLTVRMGA